MARAVSWDFTDFERDPPNGQLLKVVQRFGGRWCHQGESKQTAEVELWVGQHRGIARADEDGEFRPGLPESFNAGDMIHMAVREENGDGDLSALLQAFHDARGSETRVDHHALRRLRQ